MNIPDLISPILAYRTWQWDTSGLRSLNNEPWPAGKALEAHVTRCEMWHTLIPRPKTKGKVTANNWLRQMISEVDESRALDHVAPAEGCSCGIYAAKNFEHLVSIGYAGDDNDYGIHGEVYLWGRVWAHELGYRAQYAYPKNLTLTFNGLPFSMKEIEKRLATLTKYNVDMFLQPKEGERLLLWSAETGFNPHAFEAVLTDRARWYTFKEKERCMSLGDTLAILNHGIGIIKIMDAEKAEVHVRMFNRQIHRIAMQDVEFNQQNNRWESSSAGSVTTMFFPPAQDYGRRK